MFLNKYLLIGKLMRNLFLALVVMLLCSTILADVKKKEDKNSEEDRFITLHCAPDDCERKFSASPDPLNCSFSPEDQVFHFYRENTDKKFPLETKKSPDGTAEIEVESSTFTNDSLFYSYLKKEITEYKDGHKKSTDVIKTDVNRLTGTFEHTEHSSIGHSSGDTNWSTYIVRGSCISTNTVKDKRRKF